MSFVTIKKGIIERRVSRKTYDNHFKKHGYRIAGEEEKSQPMIEAPTEEMEETEVDVDTIPISDMNQEQIREYAKKHDIDLKGVKNTREAKALVKKAMQEKNK